MANTGLTTKDGKLYLDGEEYAAGGGSGELHAARLLLPNYMDVVVGKQCDFFLDDYIENPDNLEVRYGIPNAYPNADNVYLYERGHLRITAASAGTLDLTVKTYCGDTQIGSTQTIKIRKVVAGNSSGTKNVLIVGDSLVTYPAGLSYSTKEMYDLLDADGDVTFVQIGTHPDRDNPPCLHEGVGGKTWAWFCSSESPFYYNGGIDFKEYMRVNFNAAEIDYCIVMLGTNDTPSSIDTNAKNFIEQLVEDYPDCKVAVGIPAITACYEGVSASEKVVTLRSICKYYLNTFDNGKYKQNVTCIGQGCWIDSVHDYPHGVTTTVNEVTTTNRYTPYNNTDEQMRFQDTVHPMKQGYQQWGRAEYCKIRSWVAGNL